MHHLILYCFGKIRTPGLRQACDHYLKLQKSWLRVEEVELKPIRVPDKSPKTRAEVQKKEGHLLLEKFKKRGLSQFFLLDESQRSLSSQEWSQFFEQHQRESQSPLVFCIGSSLGFSSEIRKSSQGQISLGPQTLSHELARVVFFEQTFRAQSILHSHPYHNEGS